MKSIQSNIKKAKKYLDKNHCVAIPTETVYGLAGNAYSNLSVKKIFKLKKRPMNNPLIVHYSDINSLKNDCVINDNFIKLYKKLSPGPITFILKLKKGSKISKLVTNKQKTLAVRFPKHPLFKKLLKSLNYPLAAPSANISTQLSSVKASDVIEEFGSRIKYVLDGGKCKIGLESTIVNLLSKPTILRFGGLDISKIEKILKKKVLIKTNSKKIISPGQFPLHYSPGIPLRMNVKKPKKDEAFILIKKRKKSLKNYYYLSKKNNLKESAKNLYSLLRRIKKDGYKMIAVTKIKNESIGKTINDRLSRASKFSVNKKDL
jgi:L-threonylcarbamoyladenylate synthase